MAGMPHVMEVGSLFSVLSDRYTKANEAERKKLLHHLYISPLVIPTHSDSLEGDLKQSMFSAGFKAANTAHTTREDRIGHINLHWFGLDTDTDTGEWLPHQTEGLTTGWWNQWRGDALNIFRETLIRALEVSLGLPHNEPKYGSAEVAAEPLEAWSPATRELPLQFQWFCPSPKFEGWIQWRSFDEDDPDSGVVSVTFATPGNSISKLSRSLLASSFNPRPLNDATRLVHNHPPYDEPGGPEAATYVVEEDWTTYANTDASGPGNDLPKDSDFGLLDE